jgi:hypothetical protein
MLVAWTDARAGSTTDLYAGWIRADGQYGPGWPASGLPIATLPAAKELSALVANRRGSAIVAWRDQRNGNWDLFAYRLTTDLPVPVNGALVSSRATPDAVELEWYVASGAERGAEVQRRTATSEWTTLATIHADGAGHMRFRDANVEAGERYAYRLIVSERALEESWVQVPQRAELSFEGALPNPSTRDLTVSFALSRTGAASLRVLDVTGRAVAVREWASLEAGRHRELIADRGALAPGLYVLELAAEGRRLTRKVVVTR